MDFVIAWVRKYFWPLFLFLSVVSGTARAVQGQSMAMHVLFFTAVVVSVGVVVWWYRTRNS